MKALLLKQLLAALIGMLSPELLKNVIAVILKKIRWAIKDSKNTYDDKLLPLIDAIEQVVGIIPDDED